MAQGNAFRDGKDRAMMIAPMTQDEIRAYLKKYYPDFVAEFIDDGQLWIGGISRINLEAFEEFFRAEFDCSIRSQSFEPEGDFVFFAVDSEGNGLHEFDSCGDASQGRG